MKLINVNNINVKNIDILYFKIKDKLKVLEQEHQILELKCKIFGKYDTIQEILKNNKNNKNKLKEFYIELLNLENKLCQ